jgi:hypothetical protein
LTICDGPRGQVLGFHFDATREGKTMFAATDQGIWRSDDSGQTWTGRAAACPGWKFRGSPGDRNKATKSIRLYCTVKSNSQQDGLLAVSMSPLTEAPYGNRQWARHQHRHSRPMNGRMDRSLSISNC